ncbi:MAG: transcription-repair coupling factor [Deltaproteobacteria bacterium]|nr:transcription-repair coupling factor [Deltaproteobacteria bacterium]
MFPLTEILEDLDQRRVSSISGLGLPAAACLAASLPDPNHLVIVTPDDERARTFRDDLSFFLPGRNVGFLPPEEALPYERMLPDIERSSLRISCLLAAGSGAAPIVIPAPALLQPTIPPDLLAHISMTINSGEDMDREPALQNLSTLGYTRVPSVSQLGEMAVRGGILDIFSPGHLFPVRIELWGNSVQSIRTFDTENQRSLKQVDTAVVLPVTEVLRTPEILSRGRKRLSDLLLAQGLSSRERERALIPWDQGLDFPGIVNFLPTIYGIQSLPTDHFSPGCIVVLLEPEEILRGMEDFMASAGLRHSKEAPSPDKVYANPKAVMADLNRNNILQIRSFDCGDSRSYRCPPLLPPGAPSSQPDRFRELGQFLEEGRYDRIVIAAHSNGAADRILALFSGISREINRRTTTDGLKQWQGINVVSVPLSSGFSIPGRKIGFISDSDLFGRVKRHKSRRPFLPEWDLPIGSLAPGDFVVHIEHGIGRYLGLKQMEVAKSSDDYLHLAYAGGDSLYVPVEDMNRVQRFRSSSENPPALSKLGGAAWTRAKNRVRRSLKLMADELLAMAAKRQAAPGISFPEPDAMFREFEASFPWSETPDQERTINEVISDMMQPHPMDRLVCGDVGYGKTEVALRAAFLSVLGGKQVAVLVPTTVLAQQHYENFTQRLGPFPVTVGLLSRFVSPRDQKRILRDVKKGVVDIVIGTHRLLSTDVEFQDLGLLVIDEEHRFGVKNKEALKRMRETVDVLTLSATPIPRTLFQAFSGIRNLSLIHTPPADRKAIHTEIRHFDEDLIRDAVVREMARKGQVYIVHNRVASIVAFRDMVQRLIPNARLGMAHGQMAEGALEKVMVRFLKGELDVLITTAIIESGLDITNANTLIINRADRFGLAQLYQLRGRVGRSAALAYAYLLIPSQSSLTSKARKRLAGLRDLTDLGSGFKLASYDLEIRGSGNLLGQEQSGHIGAVGLDLYSQLLERAVRETTGQVTEDPVEPVIHLEIPALLTEEYLPDVGERLTLYKRLASAGTLDELEDLRAETADRFGKLPTEVLGLFTRMEVLIPARGLRVERIDVAGSYYLVTFHPQARISPDALLGLLSADSRLAFMPPTTLRLDVSAMESSGDRIGYLKETLRSL